MWKKTYINVELKKLILAGILANSMVAVVLYSDKLIAGLTLGEAAASAVNLVLPVAEIAMSLAYFITIGVAIKYSEAMGHFDKDRADGIFGMGVIMAVGTGVLNVALACAVKNVFFEFYGIEGEMARLCNPYFNWLIPVMLLMPLYTLMDDMIIADGDNITIIAAKLSEFAVKIGTGILFTSRIGIRGIAISTLIGMVVSITVNCTHLRKETNSIRFKCYFKFKDLPEILKMGLVDGSALIFDSVFCMALNKIVLIRLGEKYLIVITIVCFFQEMSLIFDGLGQALEPFVNVYRAQGSNDGLKQLMKLLSGWAVNIAIIWGGIIFALAGFITGKMGISDPEILYICRLGLRMLCLSYVFVSLHFLLTSYYLNIDRVGLGTVSEFIRVIICGILCPLAGTVIWGPVGLFIGMVVSNFTSLAVMLIAVRVFFGKEGYPLILQYPEGITNDRLFEYEVAEQGIMHLRNEVEEFLADCGRDRKEIITAMTLAEELSMLVKDTEPDRRILGECAVIVGKEVELIFRNNGKIVDMTDVNSRVDSLRQYFVSTYIERKFQNRNNLVTTGHNRYRFVVHD